jgi:hypothetical protein
MIITITMIIMTGTTMGTSMTTRALRHSYTDFRKERFKRGLFYP